jgi:hypothetical protein
MRRISRATTKHQSSIRVVFVDPLEREMMDLKVLRQEVADAETRALLAVPQSPDLPHRCQLPFFISGRPS